MKKTSTSNLSKTLIIAVVLGTIALSAIYSNFTGVIHLKLGVEGGEVLIDGRTTPVESKN
jgi:hypothetical protein